MKFQDLYRTLERNKYYVFSYEDILSFYPDETRSNLKKMVYRWKKKNWLSKLKKGLYELSYPKDFIVPDMHIANKLYAPSYVSMETALSNYSIIPEVSMAVTSITTKSTRRFKNKHGLFMYHTVKPKNFTGYYVERHNDFNILVAEPEKALVDYWYFKTYRNKNFSAKAERLDKSAILRLNRKKIYRYARLYNIDAGGIYACL